MKFSTTPPDTKTQNHLWKKGKVRPQLLKSAAVPAYNATRGQRYAKTSCQKPTNKYNTWNIANKTKVRSSNECWPRLIQICNVQLKKMLIWILCCRSRGLEGRTLCIYLVCEQASRGAVWRQGGNKKESLQRRLWNLNVCIEKVYAKCYWLAEMTLVMASLPLACLF